MKPQMIDWAITNRCNLNCLHCRRMASEELDGKTLLRVAAEIPYLEPKWVIIEGGEPLLREELFEVMRIISEQGIKIYLISNGMLINRDLVKSIAALNVKLMISLDGADKESYEEIRRGASFEKLKESLIIAREQGILDSCLTTVGKHNYLQVDKLFHLVKEVGCNKITFLGLKPCMDYDKYVLSEEEYEEFLFSVIRNQEVYQMAVYVDEPFFTSFLEEHRISYSPGLESGIIVPEVPGCAFGEYMFIDTNGDVKPCTFVPLAVGNVREKTLNEIWNDMRSSELVLKIKDLSTREGSCRECKYLHECGGCRARTFYLTGNWFETDPSCPLKAKQRGGVA